MEGAQALGHLPKWPDHPCIGSICAPIRGRRRGRINVAHFELEERCVAGFEDCRLRDESGFEVARRVVVSAPALRAQPRAWAAAPALRALRAVAAASPAAPALEVAAPQERLPAAADARRPPHLPAPQPSLRIARRWPGPLCRPPGGPRPVRGVLPRASRGHFARCFFGAVLLPDFRPVHRGRARWSPSDRAVRIVRRGESRARYPRSTPGIFQLAVQRL
mmetsp:Transcript_157582/g.505381  ORF Transcript_157582/g.505381 Transcript_157582/m.505381 type:complete len:220 (+) Transcript_157582:528-1187(+)